MSDFKPPYMSFATLWNFLSELCAKPLPPKLDRSIMTSKSGTDQLNIMAALEAFDFVDENGVVKEDLTHFAKLADDDERKMALRQIVEVYYAPALEISENNGTPNDLKDTFRDAYGIQGDTQRKAITFFLHAAREAGIEVSPHFPKIRSGSGAPGAPKAKKSTPRKKPEPKAVPEPASTSSTPGHTQTVRLQSGGTITLTYNVNMFEVTDDDEAFVLDLIKKLRSYKSLPEPTEPTDESDHQEVVS